MSSKLETVESLLPHPVRIKVVDIGANPIDQEPPYKRMLERGHVEVVGFEPNREALAKLLELKGPHERYYPYVLGDGTMRTFHYCQAPGMSSLLLPNRRAFDFFHKFDEWGEVVRTEQVQTIRLDDVAEIDDLDLVKIDIQGGELDVFRNGAEKLKNAVAIHTEVGFVPLYEKQPMFSDVDQYLRSQGFIFHRFAHLTSRILAPMVLNNDVYAGLSQAFEADAVYIRDFMRFAELPAHKLLKLGIILHDMYGSWDVAYHALGAHDDEMGTDLADRYLSALMGT